MKKALALAAATLISPIAAHAFEDHRLIGAWQYVSAYTELPDGTQINQFGPRPRGIFAIFPNHIYSHIVIDSDLPPVASGLLKVLTPAEAFLIAEGSLSHFGTWKIDRGGASFTIHIEQSSFPNFRDIDQVRIIDQLDAETLKYTNTISTAGPGASVHAVLRRVWSCEVGC